MYGVAYRYAVSLKEIIMENKTLKDGQLTIVDEDGKEIVCEILFTLESEEFGKNYVVFYPETEDEEAEVEVMAASYKEGENGQGELFEIETDEEWEYIEEALEQFQNQEDEE